MMVERRESKRNCSKECGRHGLVVTIGKKESIKTISTKNVTDRKQRGRGEWWAGQQTERKTKRTAYLHGEGRKRADGKKGGNHKHKSTE